MVNNASQTYSVEIRAFVEHGKRLIFSNRKYIIHMQHEITAKNMYP